MIIILLSNLILKLNKVNNILDNNNSILNKELCSKNLNNIYEPKNINNKNGKYRKHR